jgi:ubiquinol-cytochrome c reductase cytochrome c subunit
VRLIFRRFAAVTALGLLALPPGPVSDREPSPAASSPTGGRQLYEQSCASCHGVAGQGTQRGPSLAGVGPASLDFQLSTGRMPLHHETTEPLRRKPAFSAADIKSIVEYASGFGGGGGPQIPAVHPDNVQLGQTLYLDTCSACHSATGAGGALTNGQFAPDLFKATATQVGEAIRVGPGLMPAFSDQALTEQEVDAIAEYVQTLQSRHGHTDRGGLPLGRVGPVTEGMVGWLVGLALLVLVVRWLGSRAR